MSRWRVLGVAVLVALGIIGWFVFQQDDTDEPGTCVTNCEAPATPAVVIEDDLARRYSPVLYLRDQTSTCSDDGDPFNPEPVDIVLGNSEIRLLKGREPVAFGPTATDLFKGGPDLQLDYPGNPIDPGCRYYLEGARYARDKKPTAYAHIVVDQDEELLALQYWFFYYFNPWNNRHEGDWEMMQLVFEATTLREAYEKGPVEVGYSQHSGGESAPWEDKKLLRIGDHPVVYVSQGSHANFYNPAVYLGRGEQRTGVGCEETRAPHRRIDVEPVVVPDNVLVPSSAFAWLTYQGNWGERAGGQNDGPTGPNMKRAWSSPFAWQSSLRTGSVKVPETLIGPSSTSALCDIIVFLSHNFLDLVQTAPWIAGGALLGLLAAIVAAMRRTTYRPVVIDPLAIPRKAGQIITSAVAFQARHTLTFILIGLLFVPFAFIASGVEWVLLRFTPIGALTSFGTESTGQRVLLMVSLGQAQMSIGYALVTALTIAVIALHQRRQPERLRDAFSLVTKRLPALLAARVFALVVTLVLAVTIIGLPFALRYAVRWAYLEQAILLEGLSLRDAFGASSKAAATEWWWSFGTTLALAALGIALAPAVGIVLLLAFRTLDLTYVNVITSAVYVAVSPYVAIALTLVYLNLQTKESQASN